MEEAELCLQGQGTSLRPGQIRVILAHRDAKHGRSLGEFETVEVTWTIDAGSEDQAILKQFGQVALRRVRIQRLLAEALEQYGIGTQPDLAKVLQVSLRTIKRDFKVLEAEGIFLPSRGNYHGIGRGQTHKARIIDRWLRGRTYDQIVFDTHHSLSSIKRYIQTFVRVIECHRLGFTKVKIAQLLQIGEPLVREYLTVYEENDNPDSRQRLSEQLARFAKADQSYKKGGRP